jgi:hypothetical protein
MAYINDLEYAKFDWNWGVKVIFTDESWKQPFNTVFWDSITASKNDNILVKFDLWVNPILVKQSTANWWVVSESNSRLKLSTSTATNWEVIAYSKDIVRYSPWHEMYAYFTSAFVNWWVAWATQYTWIFDERDWYYVWFNWADFVIWRRKAWVDVQQITQADFWHDKLDWTWPSWFTIDFTNLNIYRITFWYLWIAPANFEVYWWHDIWWVHFADIDIAWTSEELTIESPNLPIRFEVKKISWDEDLIVYSWSWNWWYYNSWNSFVWDTPWHYNTWTWVALTWTWNEAVVNFRIKSSFNWKVSKVVSKLISAEFKNNSSDIILARVIAGPTSIWGVAVWSLTWTDINANSSTVEYATNWWVVVWWQTVYSSYMVWWWTGSWKFSWASEFDATALWLKWTPWDIFTISFQRITWSWAFTAYAVLNWIEQF